jgi:hypothetical protein
MPISRGGEVVSGRSGLVALTGLAHGNSFYKFIEGKGRQMLERATRGTRRQPAPGPEFDLSRAWAALYRAYAVARQQFSDVDWISLIAILDVIAMARAHGRRVDISYLAEEMSWPRTTALRRLRKYAGSGYLTLAREGRHTYVNDTLESRRRALKTIEVVIDSINRSFWFGTFVVIFFGA